MNIQVIAAGREADRTARGNGEAACQFAHLHDAAVRLHLMDLDRGEIRRAAGQALGRRAIIADRQIAGADVGALGRRARPGLFNHDVAGLEFLGEGGNGETAMSASARAKAESRFIA